ncbi:Amidohydrolase family protein [Penicillium ucsense]|uniref:Amidohydrolase family protein n=1 Tax=Penicillium ucsense TaxID=2839758 RepID=A0A8J8W714_9EURO|nr:Amidohydrolase family protein [Penicillium ucsense]KAF7739326.1 Amidohydrolase family protein [Penicillium ucsense]
MARTPLEILYFVEEGNSNLENYESLYKQLHSNPELSHQEFSTARMIAAKLRTFPGLKVYEKIGGTGVAAVLHNGPGKTVLLRSEMDALPIMEETNLPYSSKKTARDEGDGLTKPVMHACGHDIHMACLLAAIDDLVKRRQCWSGTLVAVFQPAEERGEGAKRMVDGGLYDLVPIPDVLLAQHVVGKKAGIIGMRTGVMMSAADSIKLTFRGKGGHASMPETTIDPVIMAASTIMRLQTIVSRQISPSQDFAVVTVGKLSAGHAPNIIPQQAEMQINVRTADENTREKVLNSIGKIARAESMASGAEEEPLIETMTRFPLTRNDTTTTENVQKTFEAVFAGELDANWPRSNASEDFTDLGTVVGKPCCFWFFGGIDKDTWDERKGRTTQDIPDNHSPLFAPAIQPTLTIGRNALIAGALTFLSKA